ncbi:hypothetical protein CEXT_289921 [Caerostris extrusa]|uniref:Uncharacterized protein n=1 Tax=Caerostris extrusa TaxID=172846 RepID=A0AAV4MJU1_CAEEX|nr:hypothetical protein CEXT_289921 [Caerostris extrusa]
MVLKAKALVNWPSGHLGTLEVDLKKSFTHYCVQKDPFFAEDPYQPRGAVCWGKTTCGNKASNPSFSLDTRLLLQMKVLEQEPNTCVSLIPPNVNVDSDATGLNMRTSKLGGVSFPSAGTRNMSMFSGSGKNIEDKVAPCAVCETPLRPSVKMFAGVGVCPRDWVQEVHRVHSRKFERQAASRVRVCRLQP